MKRQVSLSHIRAQLTGMERIVRTLRSEVESQISAIAPTEIEILKEVSNGLSRLLDEGKAVPAFSVDPYQHFAPGVWVGLDPEMRSCSATVALKAVHQGVPLEHSARVSRLTINPVFSAFEQPSWVTLEGSIDIEDLRKAKGLRCDIICFFDIAPRNTVQVPRNISLTLRVRCPDGSTRDHLNYQIPVSTMPFEHCIIVNQDILSEMNLATMREAFLVLELPRAGEFTFNLDYFSLKGSGV